MIDYGLLTAPVVREDVAHHDHIDAARGNPGSSGFTAVQIHIVNSGLSNNFACRGDR